MRLSVFRVYWVPSPSLPSVLGCFLLPSFPAVIYSTILYYTHPSLPTVQYGPTSFLPFSPASPGHCTASTWQMGARCTGRVTAGSDTINRWFRQLPLMAHCRDLLLSARFLDLPPQGFFGLLPIHTPCSYHFEGIPKKTLFWQKQTMWIHKIKELSVEITLKKIIFKTKTNVCVDYLFLNPDLRCKPLSVEMSWNPD